MKKLLILINLFIINIMSFGQDIHFSQFYDNPVIINPANTGNFTGNWRIINSYRNQGNTIDLQYKTTTITFEHPIYYYTEKMSLGMIYINDISAGNSLIINRLYLSAAYFKQISEKSFLHIGFQAGYVHKKFSLENLSFPDQFDTEIGLFNSKLTTLENLENQKTSYLDLNWGLMWSRFTYKSTFQSGIAMFHYNLPHETFFDKKNRLPIKYIFHSYLIYKLKANIFFAPKILYTYQKKASEMLIGNDLIYVFEDNTKIYAGAFYRGGIKRNSDALIIRFGIWYKKIDFCFNYDFEIYSKQNTSISPTTFELIIKYIRPATDIKQVAIPCEIF